MTSRPRSPVMFRAGAGETNDLAAPEALDAAAGPQVFLADISEFQPDINDPAYLLWSKAIVIRAAYGDQHDDRAWYGGARRTALHAGGARFLGIYQYLVAAQDGAAQARAFHALVGPIQPGEVLIADFEEGSKAVLVAWYNEMTSLYGAPIAPYLWTYTGLNFGETRGVLPVQWIAAYQSAEPATPHKLWQLTDAFHVPGVGTADCSLFHGTIDQLAALAYGGSQASPARPAQPAHPAGRKNMLIVHVAGITEVYLYNGTDMSHITSQADEQSFIDAGIPQVHVTQAQFQSLAGAPPLPAS